MLTNGQGNFPRSKGMLIVGIETCSTDWLNLHYSLYSMGPFRDKHVYLLDVVTDSQGAWTALLSAGIFFLECLLMVSRRCSGRLVDDHLSIHAVRAYEKLTRPKTRVPVQIIRQAGLYGIHMLKLIKKAALLFSLRRMSNSADQERTAGISSLSIK